MYNDNQTSTKGAQTDWEDLKMKVHVFDTYVTIKDREGHPDMDDIRPLTVSLIRCL